MKLFETTRAKKRSAGNRQHLVMGIALAIGAYLFGLAPLEASVSAQGNHVISGDSKKADKEAKKAARAAKKKEKAAGKHKEDELAKAKTGKGKGVDLGDDDPLEGL
ncbi:MAG TPA: hypothetical protein VJV78_14235 [Polyangiales bacterium]|nr:hypothetical protein [Polyangiales bacterium]